jgi:hypothetical protein
MEVIGKIKVKIVDIQVSASFKKTELVITTNEQYPQDIKIEFHQDKCDLPDPYKVGEEVEVSINLRGREWVNPQGESVYFNTIVGWRIKRPNTSQHAQPVANTAPQQFAPAQNQEEEEEDDLPF